MTDLETLTKSHKQSIPEQIHLLSPDELWKLVEECNDKLKDWGVKIPIASTIHGIMGHGDEYDDVRRSSGGFKFTALNYVGVLFYQQPSLKDSLSDDQKENLSMIAEVLTESLETIFEKVREIDFPGHPFSIERPAE